MDVVYERVLIDIDGEKRLFTVGKDGIFWKLDPRTGQYVDLTETVYQDVYERQSRVGQADLSDGHPRGEGRPGQLRRTRLAGKRITRETLQ